MVFAEGEEEQVIRAAAAFVEQELGTALLVGREDRVRDTAANAGIALEDGITIVNARLSRRNSEYAAYLYEHGIKPLEEKALGVLSLREDRETESEFVTISFWADIPSMSAFAGDDPTKIHHLDRDPEFLIELPESVQIMRIAGSHGRTG